MRIYRGMRATLGAMHLRWGRITIAGMIYLVVAATLRADAASKFWSFAPITNPAVPTVRDRVWATTDIDRFILARLETAKLTPAGEAERAVIIRRLYFDLTGLPPSESDIAAFVADTAPGAYERLVDRLLASPRFGERWGRHWLDVARFAESSGGGRSFMFPDAWRFRDYVVNATNADKPLDKFIIEQLAGDLLPASSSQHKAELLTAAGFLTLGPINYEQQDKETLRMDVIDEQIATVGRAFMGMTLDCARCHDHKFDPVPMKDYYALAGIFRSTATLKVTTKVQGVSMWNTAKLPVSPEAEAKWATHRESLAEIDKQIASLRTRIKQAGGAVADARGIDPATLEGIVVDDRAAKLVGAWVRSTFTSGYVGEGYIHDDNRDKGTKRATFTAKLPAAGDYEVRLAYTANTNRASNVAVTIQGAPADRPIVIDQRKRPPQRGGFVSLGHFEFKRGPASVTIETSGTDNYVIADAVQFIPEGAAARAEVTTRRPPIDTAALQAQLKKQEQLRKKLASAAPPAPATVMSVAEQSKPADWHLHTMGLAHERGPIVPRGFLSAASSPDKPINIPAGQSGRLALARWIASPDNPLTARVLVNRIWHKLMGRGIVRSVDNFGTTGTPPTHPQLLDHLATRFIADGWSLKKTIRSIVLSRTYRMTSTASAEALRVDPENDLLAYARRKRLDAESMRDAMLSVSGELDLTMGGRTIRKLTQYDLGYRHDTNLTRRGLYLPAFRNAIPDGFAVFDAATPNIPAGHRSVSILPTQSLYMLNAKEVTARADAAAKRLLAEPDLDIDARINLAYLRTLGRPPLTSERELAMQLIGEGKPERWNLLMQALFASIDFRYID